MKPYLAVLTLFLLSACGIEVDDLGPYWNTGKADPSLAGEWLAETTRSSEKVSFTERGGMYRVETPDKAQKDDAGLIKTLQVGNYRFLMEGPRSTYTLSGPHKGTLIRYVVTGDKLKGCELRPELVKRFLEEQYPMQHNVVMQMCGKAHGKKEWWCTDHLHIAALDSDALNLLAAIPDEATYWECEPVLTRIAH